jgi:hypothetical protein
MVGEWLFLGEAVQDSEFGCWMNHPFLLLVDGELSFLMHRLMLQI